jgi:SAM-dependent methyltransferase
VSLRFHEIAETTHRILNPFSLEKLELLGEICGLQPGMTQLDLACGKGEMLCQWARRHRIEGIGVDISEVFLADAKARAVELGVTDRVTFVSSDGAEYVKGIDTRFDVVSCIGATWIGQGLLGTLELMKPALRDRDSLLLVGEPFWHEPPPEEAYPLLSETRDDFTSLEGTLDRFEVAGFELIEMVMASLDGWDRYEAMQWAVCSDWLREHPDDPDAAALAGWIDKNRHTYLRFGRRYLGWGVFVLRQDS